MTHCIKDGKSIIVFPGGTSESFYPNKKDEPLVLRNREGFIKVSKKYNVTIVPVFTFGESDHINYPFRLKPDGGSDPSSLRWWIQKNIQKLIGVVIPLTNFMRVNTRTVIGQPFSFVEGETDAETLARYEQELIELHARHARSTDKPLRIVDKSELTVL